MSSSDNIAAEIFSRSIHLRSKLAAPYLPLPSSQSIHELVEVMRKTIFPGYYGESSTHPDALRYKVDSGIREVSKKLKEIIQMSMAYMTPVNETKLAQAWEQEASDLTRHFMDCLPEIRKVLEQDLEAFHKNDPASASMIEIICCYPGFRAITNYRLANELHKSGVPLLPRMITELVHAQTGIDIHPAAVIGEGIMIDHGTGVVIGSTSIIGRDVKLFQGVTLGAHNFPRIETRIDPATRRHPFLEDEVVVYPNASILGPVTIGKGAVIGANLCITTDVAPNTVIE